VNPRWRWAIAAGVALALAVLLYVRLDTGRMQRVLPPLVSNLTGADIRFDDLSFSMVHGLDVRLNRVRMHHASWTIEAPTALLELRVVPLLLGKIELAGIYLRSPIIHLAPRQRSKTDSVMEAHGLPRELTLDQLSVSDATLMSESGQTWITGLDMDIQDIGPSRTMRWELQARTGKQAAVGHGQLSLRLGTIDSGFGKLSLERIPLQALRSLAQLPGNLTSHLIHHGYDQLSAVLTLNIGHDDQWTLFGEAKVTGAADRPAIKLRGRAYRDATHALGWKDTFLQVGADAVLGADGSCTEAGNCTTAIRGRAVDLAPLSALTAPDTPDWQPIAGNMDVQGNLRWQGQTWNLVVQTEMQGVTWRDAAGSFVLPDLHISDLLASAKGQAIALKSARIGFAKQSGSLLASGSYDQNAHAGGMLLRLDALQDAWAPVLRLVSMVDPAQTLDIGGNGIMQGDVQLSVADDKPELHFSLDGTQAAIRIAGAKKPAALAARISGDWQPAGDDAHLDISTATLGASTLKRLIWQQSKTKRELLIDRIRLDMQALRKQGVVFPPAMHDFQGAITGNLSTAWAFPLPADRPQDLWPGMAKLTANLDLDRFGTNRWQWQGHVAFDHGQSALQDLKLTGAHGAAQLHGDISFATMKGHVDIPGGNLSWNSGDPVPAWLTAMRLSGRIKDLDVTWLGQSWTRLSTWYRLDGHALHLENLRAGLGDGNIASHSFTFGFGPGTLAVKGTAQIGALHVQKLAGLDALLSGHLTGKTFATLKVDGTLPLTTNEAGWRSDGNIMIYGGGWRPQPKKGTVQAIHHFDLLGLRFRNRHGRASVSHIQYEDAGGRYTGTATLGAGGAIGGTMRRQHDKAAFTLGGPWPYLRLTPVAPAH
jgi:hypothetical protein